MALTVGRGHLTGEAQVRFQLSLFGICGAQSCILQIFIRELLVYPVSIIPPMLHTHPQIKLPYKMKKQSTDTPRTLDGPFIA